MMTTQTQGAGDTPIALPIKLSPQATDTLRQMSTRGRRRWSMRRLVGSVGVAGALSLAALFGGVGTASASAYTIGVYAPNDISSNTKLQGWALLSRDCSGTVGCYNYIKIERQQWWGWEYVGGWWANNNGWNSITVNKPRGCGTYRTTIDSYNDIAGGYGSGVNIGQVGYSSNGTQVNRYQLTWSSGKRYTCR